MTSTMLTLVLFCTKPSSVAECRQRIETALQKAGCTIEASATQCDFSMREDPLNPGKNIKNETAYCELKSDNCSKAIPGNFGGETCLDGRRRKLSRKDGVHNGYYWMFSISYSRTICKR